MPLYTGTWYMIAGGNVLIPVIWWTHISSPEHEFIYGLSAVCYYVDCLSVFFMGNP